MSATLSRYQRELVIGLIQDERRAILSGAVNYGTKAVNKEVSDELSEAIEALKALRVTA
jgi:hypothetical protein